MDTPYPHQGSFVSSIENQISSSESNSCVMEHQPPPLHQQPQPQEGQGFRGSSSPSLPPSTGAASPGNVAKSAYFWGSSLATVLPGYFGKKLGITSNFLHWNFITDQIILGALPVVTSWGDSGDHLRVLKDQLAERNMTLGLVIACLENMELDGFGVKLVEFAKESNWRDCVNPHVQYIHLSFEDTTARIPFVEVAKAVEQLHGVVQDPHCAVFVHCKAGKGRSWMVVMGYLTTYGKMPFAQASELVKNKRPQVNPSKDQVMFASSFQPKFDQWKASLRGNAC